MHCMTLRSTLFLFLLALIPGTLAAFTNFSIQVNTTEAKCGDIPFGCGDDAVCAYDDKFQRHYCCEVGNDGICQTFQNEGNCDGNNNRPTNEQIGCSRFGSDWCCLKDFESCTVRSDNINLCWLNAENPFGQANLTRFTEIYVSLEAENPSASTIPIDTSSLFQELSGTSATPSSSPTSSPTPNDSSSSSLSGGAIGGIVVGVIAGLAAVIGAVWFFLRQKKKEKSTTEGSNYPRNDAYPTNNGYPQNDGYPRSDDYTRNDGVVYAKIQPEMQYGAELESHSAAPVELDSGVEHRSK